jgi:hypothetical protein
MPKLTSATTKLYRRRKPLLRLSMEIEHCHGGGGQVLTAYAIDDGLLFHQWLKQCVSESLKHLFSNPLTLGFLQGTRDQGMTSATGEAPISFVSFNFVGEVQLHDLWGGSRGFGDDRCEVFFGDIHRKVDVWKQGDHGIYRGR